ncbi:MAG: hypothetical protein IJ307_05930 [Bacteroidales bacterium]|nr:hypothetical protein [Bacteroidales bacterium]
MFGKNDIDINMIVTTSKMALKASCIRACNNDVEKAEKLYDFFIKDIKELPDFDVQPPSAFEQIKTVAGDVFGWIEQNQDKLVGAYNIFQSVRGGQPINVPTGSPIDGIPPIPE